MSPPVAPSSESVPVTPLREELRGVASAFEEATGLQLCVRPLATWNDEDGHHLVPGLYAMHRSAFCDKTKERHLAACKRCDVDELPRACTPGKGPFVRTCHAGADEVLVPLWVEGRLAGVAFLGQFRREDTQPDTLRKLEPARVERLLQLAVPLRSYLQDVARRIAARRRLGDGLSPASRGAAVEAFLRTNVARDPSLEELAKHLSLSASRTSHLVRRLTGKSFRELKEERKLAVARDLLAGTEGKIAWVAGQAGFRDPAYFCRLFRAREGMTAGEFRNRHRRREPTV